MKIYDKKLFWQSITTLLAVLAYFVLLYLIEPDENTKILWTGAIVSFISTAKSVSVSISEEKSKIYRHKEQLASTASANLFGKKSKYVPWLRFVPLVLSVLIASSNGNMALATVLLVLPVVYLVWFIAVIEKEVKRIISEENIAE